MKRIAPILLALALASACNSTDPFLYRAFLMGNPNLDGSLKGDDGITYVFNELPDWSGAKRVVALLDVLKDLGDSTCQARLQSFSVPIFKQPVVVEGQMPDSLGTESIFVSDVWFSGGCLNMSNVINVKTDGSGKHLINLAYDKAQSSEDTLKFIVKHNYPEGYEDGCTVYEYVFYSSFPLSGLMPERDSTVLKISWEWNGSPASIAGKVKI